MNSSTASVHCYAPAVPPEMGTYSTTSGPPGRWAPPGTTPGDTTTNNTPTPSPNKASRRRDYIARYWTIACEDRVCVNCGCGRSLELLGKGVIIRDDLAT
jgi:hypothetical protein